MEDATTAQAHSPHFARYTFDDIYSWPSDLTVPICIVLDSAFVPFLMEAIERDHSPLVVKTVGELADGFLVGDFPIANRLVFYPENLPPQHLKHLIALQQSLGAVLRELPAPDDFGRAFYFPGSLIDWLQQAREPTEEQQAELLAAMGETFEWPTMAEEAYYGLAGEFCNRLDDHTEADNACE